MTRYFNNIVNDYFIQTTIDFLLGIAAPEVFEEFETNLMSADPAISLRRIRQTASEFLPEYCNGRCRLNVKFS